MIFIILLVIVFGMVVSTMQFGSAPDGGSNTTATSRAQVYAVNMETWHQAAILALSLDSTPIGNDLNCTAIVPTACDLNKYMRSSATPFTFYNQQNPPPNGIISPLMKSWPEYQPIVMEGDPTQINTGGWQSFLLRNINGTNATIPGTDGYVLTVFRGFGFGGNISSFTNIASGSKGNLSNAQIANALGKTIQDRMGVGNLLCTGGATGTCSFTRAAAYTVPGAQSSTSDLPLQFPVSAFTVLQGSAGGLPATPTPDQILNGLPAIMTRVASKAPGACSGESIAWGASGYVPGQTTSDPSTYQCVGNLGNTTNGAPAQAALLNVAATQSGYSGPLLAQCQNGNWVVSAGYGCSNGGGGGGGGGQSCFATELTWGSCCSAWPASDNNPDGSSIGLSSINMACPGIGSATCNNGTWQVHGGACGAMLPP